MVVSLKSNGMRSARKGVFQDKMMLHKSKMGALSKTHLTGNKQSELGLRLMEGGESRPPNPRFIVADAHHLRLCEYCAQEPFMRGCLAYAGAQLGWPII